MLGRGNLHHLLFALLIACLLLRSSRGVVAVFVLLWPASLLLGGVIFVPLGTLLIRLSTLGCRDFFSVFAAHLLRPAALLFVRIGKNWLACLSERSKCQRFLFQLRFRAYLTILRIIENIIGLFIFWHQAI